MVILLCYTSAFSEVTYAGFYATILNWNFRLVDENSQILVVVFVSKLNYSFSFFRFVDKNCWIFIVVVVFVTKINLFSSTKIFVFVGVNEKKHWFRWSTLLCRPVLDYAFVMDIDCLRALHTEQHLILSGTTAIMTPNCSSHNAQTHAYKRD